MIDFAHPIDKKLPNHRVHIATARDWLAGVLLVAVILILGAELDKAEQRIAHAEAERAAATARANIRDTTATVRLVPLREGGWTCEQMHVRAEWSLAVGHKCQELAALLQVARATP